MRGRTLSQGVVIKKKLMQLAASAVIASTLAAVTTTSANAFTLYEDANYGGYGYHANWAKKDGLGTINNKASSVKNSPGKWFYDGRGYTGRKVYIYGNNANLKKLKTNLPWYQNWNDRFESYK